MDMLFQSAPAGHNASHTAPWQSSYEDPADPDLPTDVPVVTTRRGLCRMAMVAADTATRFQRDGVDVDPVAWMLSPRKLFGGATALEACLGQNHFMRASLLHGLAIGLDAEPSEIDALAGDGFDDGDGRDIYDLDDGGEDGAEGYAFDDLEIAALGPDDIRLYTATIAFKGGGVIFHAFHASLARTAREVGERLRRRYGEEVGGRATIVSGFRTGGGFVGALVSPALAEMLRDVAANPSSPIAAGLDLNLEQCFDA